MEQTQVQLEVVGVRVELPSNHPVLILRGAAPENQELHLAVIVGPAEAAAVARALQGEVPPRPMTHDLLTNVLESYGQGIDAVEIRLLNSSTYAASIQLNSGAIVDARASDAIAVAVRAHCRVTMELQTLRSVSVRARRRSPEAAEAGGSPESQEQAGKGPISEDEIREFKKFIAEVGPEDFDRS